MSDLIPLDRTQQAERGGPEQISTFPRRGSHFLKGPSDSLATGHNGKPHPAFNWQGVTVDSMTRYSNSTDISGKNKFTLFFKKLLASAVGRAAAWRATSKERDEAGVLGTGGPTATHGFFRKQNMTNLCLYHNRQLMKTPGKIKLVWLKI